MRLATERLPPLVLHRTLAALMCAPRGLAGARLATSKVRRPSKSRELGSFGVSGDSTPMPIASVAKVMTAYLTLLEHPLGAGERGISS